jgi:hypothetical protein
VNRRVPKFTQTSQAVQNRGGHTLATRAGKRKGICQHRTDLLFQLLADAVQPGPTVLERMPNSIAASSTFIPSTTPWRKQFGLCDKLQDFALRHGTLRIVEP